MFDTRFPPDGPRPNDGNQYPTAEQASHKPAQFKFHPCFRLYVVPVIYFQVPDGASLGPAHKCPQPRNGDIGALWSETAVLTLPQAKALLRTEYPLRIWSNRR